MKHTAGTRIMQPAPRQQQGAPEPQAPMIKSEITPPPEWAAPLHAGGGFASAVFLIGVAVIVIIGFSLQAIFWLLFATLAAGLLPYILFGLAIQLPRMFVNNDHYRGAIEALERSWQMDINGDGFIGAAAWQRNEDRTEALLDTDYGRVLYYWTHGGSTLRDNTCNSMGIDARQWQQFRDKALRLKDADGKPIFLKTTRQGKGYGLMIASRYRNRWDIVSAYVK